MSPRSRDAGVEAGASERAVAPLLDVAFGLFVWMGHLLTLYIITALACGLGLIGRGGRTATAFLTTLAVLTLVATATVAIHAVVRWRQQRELPELRFRAGVTVGADAIAIVAVVWQLLAIALVPVCA
jgi:hypothetical protein